MRGDVIGVFDSGIGGLTVLKKLVKNFPNQHFIYLGDNENAPYGNKSIEELVRLTKSNIDKLADCGAKVCVCACYTVSVNVLPYFSHKDLPIYGIYLPNLPKNKRNLVLATNATVNAYKNNGINADFVALKDLAGEIEKNVFDLEKVKVNTMLKEVDRIYDNVVLGCTHYPFISAKIGELFPNANILGGEKNLIELIKQANVCSSDHQLKNNVKFIGSSKDKNEIVYKTILK